VFVRGFIKAYAQFLGIEAKDALLALDRAQSGERLAPKPGPRPAPAPAGDRAVALHARARAGVALLVLVIVLVVVAAHWLAP
jgi:cytoskeletal protein RodZ